jgi:rhodanese-related sulfurtransferase
MPTHGFGSFCAATSAGEKTDTSTIGREREINPVLSQDEADYVASVIAGLDAFPAYYAHMGPANAAGPGAPDLSLPERADKDELRRRLEAGEWLVDLRHRTAFAAGHVPRTFNMGLDGQFSTYLGWLIPWGTPVTLLADTPEQVAEARGVGVPTPLDRPAAQATGRPEDWTDEPLATLRTATFADLAQVRHHREVTVLDVRRNSEWRDGHLVGVVHIPLHELLQRMDELPDGEIWVHCASGYRSSIASSLIAATGRRVVSVNDTYATSAAQVGLPVEAELAAS